ncbi:MAG: hypothetical protein JWO45_279 [Spartobacteria bacterium]|nr:hypothetical protein [Spartobacteria bacterium]
MQLKENILGALPGFGAAAKLAVLLTMPGPLVSVGPELIIPTTPGMSWPYNMTQETGEGVRFSKTAANADGRIQASVIYRLNGSREVNGKTLLEFEMHREGRITNTDLLTVDDQGINCWARIDENGKTSALEHAQTIVCAPLRTGAEWNFESEVEGEKLHQHYRVIGEEEIAVPAGKFRAFHIYGEQSAPVRMNIDRWFVAATGIVKDVTETRSENGDLLRRISLELSARPKVSARPVVRSPALEKKLTATLGQEAIGTGATEFVSTTPKIYARWQGGGLREGAKIRVVWIAEKVADIAPPDYVIDEATTAATAPDSHGIFALSRPETDWTPGDYRVEFYVDGALTDAVKLKITKLANKAF